MDAEDILTINAGSSSIKLDLYFFSEEDRSYRKSLEATASGIGQTETKLTYKSLNKEKQTTPFKTENYQTALEFIINWLVNENYLQNVSAIVHRIVHGGMNYKQTTLIDTEFINYLKSSLNLDPEHVPAEIGLIEEFLKNKPNTTQFACFDTAFFNNLPTNAKLLTLPRILQTSGLRRYGFHGLSYTYLNGAFREIAGDVAANGRVIYAHLGSGVSLAAMKGGKPIDTTMGFTPASGIMMSSRSGDLDPGISWYLQKELNISAEQFHHMINFESGLLGVSGLSADMYTLLQNEDSDQNAAEAVNLFVYQVKKTIGAYSAALGGLDSLIFSGGIGEQSSILRARICDGLEFLGVEIDGDNNQNHATLISSINSQVGVHVIPTDESAVMLNQVTAIINQQKK